MPHRDTKDSEKLWNSSNIAVQHAVNKWAARIVPAILIGAVGYSVWAIIVILCINYLIHPPAGVPRQLGAGVAIIVVYFVLMVLMALAYLRILWTIVRDPGFVPRNGEMGRDGRRADRKRRRHREDGIGQEDGSMEEEKEDHLDGEGGRTIAGLGAYTGAGPTADEQTGPAPRLEFFYKRDIFECEVDGLPRWCSTCKIWRPDRSHHSSELGRCVYKMDHFCPWAGGIISESNFKFFIQFCTYASMFCLFLLVVSAYFSAERHHQQGHYSKPVLAIIGISAVFLLFSFSMAWNSLFAVFINSTTVDNLSRRSKVYHFAVLIPPGFTPAQPPTVPPSILQTSAQYPAGLTPTISNPPQPEPYRNVTYPFMQGNNVARTTEPIRTFAILATPVGTNPYSLSSPLQNFKTVMGDHWYDWFLPFRHSPCWDAGHGRKMLTSKSEDEEKAAMEEYWADRRLMYKTGPVVDDMIRRAGLPPLQKTQ